MSIRQNVKQPSWSEEYLRGIVTATSGKIDGDEIRDFAASLQQEFFGYSIEGFKFKELNSIIFDNEVLPFLNGLIDGLSGKRLEAVEDIFNNEAYQIFEESVKEVVHFDAITQTSHFTLIQMHGNKIVQTWYFVPQYVLEEYLYQDSGFDSSDIY